MNFWRATFLIALFILLLEILAIYQIPDTKLRIVTCDVGQGDAILIIKGKVRILVDGGPDNKVLDCLGKYLPFWDRKIDLVILSHPEKDHYGGLVEVFKRYKVDNFLCNLIVSGNPEYQLLEKAVGSSRPKLIYPLDGMIIRLGLIYLDIFNPNRELLSILQESKNQSPLEKYSTVPNLNAYSIVARLRLGSFSALFTGDATTEVLSRVAKDLAGETVYYIKISHHGSDTGTTDNFLKAFMPKIAVISVGKNNYGQPSNKILSILKENKIETLRTDQLGDVEIKTDGFRIFDQH